MRQKNIARFLSNSEFKIGLFYISIEQTFIFEEKSNILWLTTCIQKKLAL